MNSVTSNLALINSPPPVLMSDWGKNKITKIAQLYREGLHYSERASLPVLACSAAHQIFDDFYYALQQKSKALSFEKEVVVLTQVLPDGLGDYYTALAVAKIIRKSFPQQKVYFVSVFSDAKQADKVSLPKKIEYQICKPGCSYPQVVQRISNASFVLEIPWEVDSFTSREIAFAKEAKRCSPLERISIWEYGSPKHPHMGLDYQEYGIVIKEKPKNTSLALLQNEVLKNFLFNTPSPTNQDIENYFKTHELFFCYIPSNQKLMRMFLYTATSLHTAQDKIIDIISPLSQLDKELDLTFFKEQGVGMIRLINQQGIFDYQLADKGRVLRLFNPFPLPQKDIHRLMINSHLLTGCTGDQSFSEAISFNKLPFYELRPHKQLFFWQYLRLAHFELPSAPVLEEYLSRIMANMNADELSEQEITQRATELGKLLDNPSLQQETQSLNEILKNQFSFNKSLQGILAKKMCYQRDHSLNRLQEAIIAAICKQTVASFQEIWDRLEQKQQESTSLQKSL